MEEKPRIDIRRFQSPKMKKKYLLKFALYVLVLLSLLIWYQQQKNAVSEKIKTEKNVEPDEFEMKDLKIEP